MLNSLFSGCSVFKKKKELGRGPGCGKGKRSGRGNKGQKARAGSSVHGFEGGQQPIFKRLPKRGFNPLDKTRYVAVNLSDIDRLIGSGKIAEGAVIDKQLLKSLGLVSSMSKPVKVLGKSELGSRVVCHCEAASHAAKSSITFVAVCTAK